MVNLKVPGREVPPEKPERLLDGLVTVRTVHQAEATGVARGGFEQAVFDAAEDDVIEIEWEGGVREWVRVDQWREDLAARAPGARGGGPAAAGAGGDIQVPAFRPSAAGTRGAGGWALKALKVFKIDIADELATAGVKLLVSKIEDAKREKDGIDFGLHRLREDFSLELLGGPLDQPEVPYLVFLHGTASSTWGSFGNLTGKDKDEETGRVREGADREWQELRRIYGNRILALEHRSLSVSPVQNALDLLALLPAGAKLHLVSHSRGGLIGELLSRGRFTDEELEPLARAQRKDHPLFQELARLLAEKKPRVERFVRVACPARGTVLAGERLDRYLSVLLNLFGMIPLLRESVLYDVLKATLVTLAKKRADMNELPGLEAMMPRSPVIHLLNTAGLFTDADLGVISGDIEGEGVWGQIKIFATDVFYRQDHDLVVNTESMYEGVAREKVYFLFDKGPKVNHFSYFKNDTTRAALYAWLTRQGTDVGPFKLRQKPVPAAPRAAPAEGRKDGPVIFLVPDLFASALKPEGEAAPVWLDLKALARGKMTLLEAGKPADPESLLPGAYEDLIAALAKTNEVRPFPYDWRLSFLETGASLAGKVREELGKHQRPLRFLAHGAGGLVVRAMIASDGDLWQKVVQGGGRLVQLGTPNRGSSSALRLLFGRETLVRLLSIVDFGRGPADLLGLLRGYPSLLELLPEPDAGRDFFKPKTWRDLQQETAAREKDLAGAPVPAQAALQSARRTRTTLDAGGRDGILQVAGVASWTPELPSAVDGRLVFEQSPQGDGQVTYAQGLLDRVPTWYMGAGHNELARSPGGLLALIDLLERGSTTRLPQQPPVAPVAPVPAEEPPLLFPTQEELLGAVLGVEPPAAEEETFALRISVAHGDLTHARHPIAVGHYAKDTIVHAEAFVDRQLGGALTERYQLGLYPGPVGTAEVVLAPGRQPAGTLIIGLGDLGEVTPQAVTDGVTVAALRYALTRDEQAPARGEEGKWRSAAFSALLLGTGGGRSLSVEESVAAVVKGAVQANRALKNKGLWERVRIDEVEFVELYETVAIRAARTVRRLKDFLRFNLEAQERIEAAPHLRIVPGGRVRQPGQYDRGWWRRLLICYDKPSGMLEFQVLTERARTEDRTILLQPAMIDQFVAEAAQKPQYDRRIAETLFELLLPNDVKDAARSEADVVLIVDDHTAQYPWELLAERSLDSAEPLAVSTGVIRQLATGEGYFRNVVRGPEGRFALVVGDPVSHLDPLPGAEQEAREVAEALRLGGYEPCSVIRKEGWEVIMELFARDYQILHLAGHGEYNANNPRASGMVIHKDFHLTAAELEQLRTVPPLVFLNCCYLGRVDRGQAVGFSRLAASLATQLIRMGVRAVVAAGWPVNDRLASIFAREFYQAMLGGQSFGRAVLRARKAAFGEDPVNNTWGAYQCYGDPDFVLELRPGGEGDAAASADSYVSDREVLDELQEIQAEAGRGDPKVQEKLGKRIAELDRTLPGKWRSGEVLTAFGAAYRAVGDWPGAIAAYRQAIEDEKAKVTLSAVQTLANLEIRYADRLRRTAAPSPGDPPGKLIEQAKKRLDWLLELGKTPERLSLIGSAYKRIAAATEAGDERNAALATAAKNYQEAYRQTLAEDGFVDPYPALNWITCQFLLGAFDLNAMLALIADCERSAAALVVDDPSFFIRVYAADAALHRHLLRRDLPQQVVEVLALYRRALSAGSVATEVSSVTEQLDFLIAMMGPQDQALTESLGRIVTALKQEVEAPSAGRPAPG